MEYVKKSRMLNGRSVQNVWSNVPAISGGNNYRAKKQIFGDALDYEVYPDCLWLLNQIKTNHGENIYWHCIYHEIKTGRLYVDNSIESIYKKYIHKFTHYAKEIGTTDSPLWIWAWDKEIYDGYDKRKHYVDKIIRDKVNSSSIRFCRIEWLLPLRQKYNVLLNNRISESGVLEGV